MSSEALNLLLDLLDGALAGALDGSETLPVLNCTCGSRPDEALRSHSHGVAGRVLAVAADSGGGSIRVSSGLRFVHFGVVALLGVLGLENSPVSRIWLVVLTLFCWQSLALFYVKIL